MKDSTEKVGGMVLFGGLSSWGFHIIATNPHWYVAYLLGACLMLTVAESIRFAFDLKKESTS